MNFILWLIYQTITGMTHIENWILPQYAVWKGRKPVFHINMRVAITYTSQYGSIWPCSAFVLIRIHVFE